MVAAAQAAPRQRVTGKRLTGTLVQWRGKFGWIQPDEEVSHDDAGKRGGKIYLALDDVEGQQKPKPKSTVSFFVYADDSGLGAEKCQVTGKASAPSQETYTKTAGVQRTIQKQKGGAARWPGNGSKGATKKGAALALATKGSQGGANGYGKAGKGAYGYSKGAPNGHGKGGKTGPKKGAVNGSGKGAAATLSKGAKGAGKKGGKAATGKARKGGQNGAVAVVRGPPPAPDQKQRERVFAQRLLGTVARWKGSQGWIRPDGELQHPEIERHRGGIYLHQVDIQPGHEMFKGAQVSFFLYLDADGLGAEHCMVLQGQRAPAKQQRLVQLQSQPRRAVAKVRAKTVKGAAAGQKGVKVEVQEPKQKVHGLGKLARSQRKKKTGQDGKKPKASADLPRTRLTADLVTGEVLEWKGKFGWIKPTEAVDHELSSKNGGRIYVNAKDLTNAEQPLTAGETVQFHVYADSSGLGAEECTSSA